MEFLSPIAHISSADLGPVSLSAFRHIDEPLGVGVDVLRFEWTEREGRLDAGDLPAFRDFLGRMSR
jgi:hypothetical protein